MRSTRFLLVLASCAVACGVPSSRSRTSSSPNGLRVIHVDVQFRAGASRTFEPARLVHLSVRAASNRVAWSGAADRAGRASIRVPPDAAWLFVETRIDVPDAPRLAVTSDGLGLRPFRARVQIPPDDRLRVRLEGERARAFQALDTMLGGLDAASRWTGRAYPPLFACWRPGERTAYSRAAFGVDVGARRFRVGLGSDHAEAPSVVLHEVGHFVLDQLGADTLGGGLHSPARVVSPGVAWNEGAATWFSAVVRANPRFEHPPVDGRTPSMDLEHRSRHEAPDRLDSEATVQRVLWDLVDGSALLPDEDGDGIALAPAQVFTAIRALAAERETIASLSALLLVLVEQGAVTSDDVQRALERTRVPLSIWIDRREQLWPPVLEPGVAHEGRLVGAGQPHADGAATHFVQQGLRVRVDRPSWVRLRLSLDRGGGRPDLVSLAAQQRALDRVLEERGLHVSLRLETATGERVAATELTQGEHEWVELVRHPGTYLLTIRQREIAPVRYSITSAIDPL